MIQERPETVEKVSRGLQLLREVRRGVYQLREVSKNLYLRWGGSCTF
jgi:hypothetical protein